MAHATIALDHKGFTFDIDIEADVIEGGSNSHGSDEPAWIQVESACYTNPRTGKPVSARLTDWINSNHLEYVDDMLVEAYKQG